MGKMKELYQDKIEDDHSYYEEEIKRLRETLQKVADGDVERVSAEKWRTDGQYSKNDKCKHGHFMYEECAECLQDFARAAL